MKRVIFIIAGLWALLPARAFAQDGYAACASVCTIEAVRAECLADCSRSSRVVTSYASVGDLDAFKETATNPERSQAAVESHKTAIQGADVAQSQQAALIGQAVVLMTGNPTPVEMKAADQLMIWAQAQGSQARASREAANQNWQQCLLLKGNAPNGCAEPAKDSEFIVTPEMAGRLENLGIGRLEFQGKVQAGDWAWVRSVLNIGSAELTKEEEAAAKAIASSTHAPVEDTYSPPQPLQADAISYGAPSPFTPQVQDAPPSDSEMRAVGVVSLPPSHSLFTFASRKFSNWRRSNR